MTKPEDIPQDIWDPTNGLAERFTVDVLAGQLWDIRHTISRCIQAERQKCASIALDIAEKNAGYSDGPGAMRVYNAISANLP